MIENTDKLTLFRQIIEAHKLYTFFLPTDLTGIEAIDLQLRHRLYREHAYEAMEHFFRFRRDPTELTDFSDAFSLHWFHLFLPEKNDPMHCIIGPFLQNKLSAEHIRRVMEKLQLPDSYFKDLTEYYNILPVFDEADSPIDWLLPVISNFLDREYVYSVDSSLASEAVNYKELNPDPGIAATTLEERYAREEALLDAISAGDFAAAMQKYYDFTKYRLNPRTTDTLRNTQNMMIIFNTLCRKTLQIKNQIHPYYLDEASSRIAIAINESKNLMEVGAIPREMIRRYCILAKNHSLRGYSHIVQKVVTYIEFHYTEKISLQTVAEKFNISRSYLSGLFKRDTGMTLTDYIHSVRIRRALLLLNSTTLPIGVIATACGYDDVNYFIRVFKKQNGQSPRRYSRQISR